MYVIGVTANGILVINKEVKESAKYDPEEIVRAEVDVGTLPSEDKNVKGFFGDIGDKQ
jgi:hypothetical protein